MQKQFGILPLFVNTDKAVEKLDPTESPFLKDVSFDINGNPNIGLGSNNSTGEGQNLLKLTAVRSNKRLDGLILPAGFNKNIGSFESETTQELYYFNFNSEGNHGIYVIEGNSLAWSKIIEDPELNFSDDQEAFIADHRVTLRVVYNSDKSVKEKYLIFTNGQNWQYYVNIIAAIRSNGFDATLYPYWKLQPPHFDRRELFEYAVRPPMYKPEVQFIPNAPSEQLSNNRTIDKSFQFATAYQYTDKRQTALSPYSLPLIFKSEDYLNNPDELPKRGRLTLYAGSPMVEKQLIYVRKCGGNWYLYDTIDKYSTCGVNDPAVIGNDYWLRKNPWTDYNYNPNLNQIEYIFDYDKIVTIVDQEFTKRLQNDIPIRSVAQSDLGDSVLYGYNEYGYPNFDCEVLGKLNVEVKEKELDTCPVALRRIRLYAYIGYHPVLDVYISQVGYYLGEDKQMRFGGIIKGNGDTIDYRPGDSTAFNLTFADRDAFRCYLKGTPYYADGKWFQVNSDNSLVEIEELLDLENGDIRSYIERVYDSQGYFVCVFDFFVPAGKYLATLARHNVSNSADWINQSTYIMGIANSRNKYQRGYNDGQITTIQPSAIVSYSKEQEIDCTSANVDVWGNNKDLFYIFCPYQRTEGNNRWRFVEGYFYESAANSIPIELFSYTLDTLTSDGGTFTDKNGFYFAYTTAVNADEGDVKFTARVNCAYPTVFISPTSETGFGWKPNNKAYLTSFNSGVVGACNKVVYSGLITNLDGTIPYNNIGISIANGATVYTRIDGTFDLIIHNGQFNPRSDNVYVNAPGNYYLTTVDCGVLPLYNYSETLSPCVNCQGRNYPLPLNLQLKIQGATTTQTSLKEAGKYSVGIAGADLAGRLMYVNPIEEKEVSSFLVRDNTNATYFQLLKTSGLGLSTKYPDMKWLGVYVSKNINILRFFDWVGDKIDYIDSQGNVTSDATSAVFCAIYIDSLYNYNTSKNFNVLTGYSFVEGDRIRVLDNGDGDLLDTTTYGDPIDIQVLGTNYNQAAINAGLIPPSTNTVLNTNNAELSKSVTLIVRYDSRFDVLKEKTGFWIEVYTPAQETDVLQYCETTFFPVVNGEIAIFNGYTNGQPLFDYPTEIDIPYWDTYLYGRNIAIPDVGTKFFNHSFQSPNISDTWGADCSSCGRQHVKNDNAQQLWYKDDVIRSDDFVTETLFNGLATFRTENRKNFKGYSWGGIIGIIPQRSVILFICENDWFATNFNFQYVFANESGVMIANLNNKLSEPIQKVGDNFGCALEDTATIIAFDKSVYWYDYKNSDWIECNYSQAKGLSINGMQAYFNVKTAFIKSWNNSVEKGRRFDVVAGVDKELSILYVTFRPRRNNTNNPISYINNRRNWDVKHQETVAYHINTQKWIAARGFTPEGYGNLKGRESALEMFAFAAGIPYRHKNTGNESFCTFFGQVVEPVVMGVFNSTTEVVSILQSISLDSTDVWIIDFIYSNEPYSFSYIPLNYMKRKENQYYAEALRNMVSYLSSDEKEKFRSTLQDGKRVFGNFFAIRVVGNPNNPSGYRELRNIYSLQTGSPNNKK